MKYIITAIVILMMCFTGKAIAQKDTATYYLDSSLVSSSKSQAMFVGKMYFKDNLWHTIIYYRFLPYKLMTGSYTDKNSALPEGQFTYFTNDTIIMQGNYHNARQDGVWKRWTTTGLITDSVVFNDGTVLSTSRFKYHENGHLWRYTMETPENEKVTREFDTADVMVSQGRFKGNDGEMFIYYPDGKVKSHSIYKKGTRTLYEQFDEQGRKN